MKKHKNIICIFATGAIFAILAISSWFLPAKDFSLSERRKLAQRPDFSINAVHSGSFMANFEKYTMDQFPFRDTLRSIKAYASYGAFGQLDNHGVYVADGYAAKLEYPLNLESIDYAAGKFGQIHDRYLAGKDMNIYFSIIPDKSYFLAKDYGYLSLDYDALFDKMRSKMDFAKYIDITKTLEIDDYYKTDTHWRQENLVDTSKALAGAMDISISSKFTKKTLDKPFYGVYYGQSALQMPPEPLCYLTNEILDSCILIDQETGKQSGIYNMEKAAGKDPYEMFLSGSRPLVTIKNPKASSDKELIIFRDSFGSSIAPLLAEGYAKITLVDIRYLRSDFLGKFIDFDHQDVLFLYSTSILNNSSLLN